MIDENREIREGWIHEFHTTSTPAAGRRPRLYYIPVIMNDRAILYTEDGLDEIGRYPIGGRELMAYAKIIPIKKFNQPEPRIGQDEYLRRMGIR